MRTISEAPAGTAPVNPHGLLEVAACEFKRRYFTGTGKKPLEQLSRFGSQELDLTKSRAELGAAKFDHWLLSVTKVAINKPGKKSANLTNQSILQCILC
jgi:hypothetical protein